jgi:hypothetical protein
MYMVGWLKNGRVWDKGVMSNFKVGLLRQAFDSRNWERSKKKLSHDSNLQTDIQTHELSNELKL